MTSKYSTKEVLKEKIKALEEEIKRLKDRESKQVHTEKALSKSKTTVHAL